ncbi:hypothetical protein QR680_007649 [Steinernema hermaphroditum]|uniref:RNase NYN domain-containing protein n=1 Tax=Steinernema hermaphroditum TaxID=289476 RepID=A0AA39M5Q1_9BILA|nr:hypothetical protein QR680_007649 [Steinernema hermaphroditum]
MQSSGERRKLRPIFIDGIDVANTHGNALFFSCPGLVQCVNYFKERGHTDILVFVPQNRREVPRNDFPIVDQHILLELEEQKHLVWTPTRKLREQGQICNNASCLLQAAVQMNAVVVSNCSYDFITRRLPEYIPHLTSSLLMYSFMGGRFYVPTDPRGRRGMSLQVMLTEPDSTDEE